MPSPRRWPCRALGPAEPCGGLAGARRRGRRPRPLVLPSLAVPTSQACASRLPDARLRRGDTARRRRRCRVACTLLGVQGPLQGPANVCLERQAFHVLREQSRPLPRARCPAQLAVRVGRLGRLGAGRGLPRRGAAFRLGLQLRPADFHNAAQLLVETQRGQGAEHCCRRLARAALSLHGPLHSCGAPLARIRRCRQHARALPCRSPGGRVESCAQFTRSGNSCTERAGMLSGRPAGL